MTSNNREEEEVVSGTFTWVIENFSKLNNNNLFSDVFTIAGFKWRILVVRPKWLSDQDPNGLVQLAIYLGIADASSLAPGWSRYSSFSLTLVNRLDTNKSITKPATGSVKEFTENHKEWGFKSFIPLIKLYDSAAGYLVNDTCIVEARLNVSIRIGDQGSNFSASTDHSEKEHKAQEPLVLNSKAENSSPAPKTPCSEFQHTPDSEKVCTEPADGGPTEPSLVKELGELPTNLTGELMEFRGLGQIEKAFIPLLEEVCSLHPSLIECLHKRNRMVVECALTALGGVLHFLKTTKVKDMTEDACARIQSLWEDVHMFKFDLAWLEPHVQSALDMEKLMERSRRVKRLREDVDILDNEMKRRSAALAVTEVDLEIAKRDLEKEEKGIAAIDMDSELGYGN
ncbi:hypothetical protein ACFX2A_040958 [Malus domestica]